MNKIRQDSMKAYRKGLGGYLSYSFLYGFFILIVLALAYFLPASLIISIPFLVVPLTFGLQVAISTLNHNIPYSPSIFFVGFRNYFSRRSFGSYSLLFGFLKSAAIYSLVTTIALGIFLGAILNKDETFLSLIDIYNNATELSAQTEALNNILSYEPYVNYSAISSAIGFGLALYEFLHHFFNHSIKVAISFYVPENIDVKSIKFMHRIGFKTFRKSFYKDYYGSIWFIIPLFILGYAGGITLGYFLIDNINMFQLNVLGSATAFIMTFLFIPYIFNVIESLYIKNAPHYIEATMNNVLNSYDDLANDPTLTPEEKVAIDKMKEEIEKEANKEEDNNKDSSNEE